MSEEDNSVSHTFHVVESVKFKSKWGTEAITYSS